MSLADRWLDRARNPEISRDAYDRFIYAYIAFNYLYEGIRLENESERACVARYAEKKCKEFNVNPFSVDVSEYKYPVGDMKNIGKSWAVRDSDITSLFNAIYQVRCNLFHGNKFIGDLRDENLARQGAEVLIMLLSKILNRSVRQPKN